MRMSAGLRKIRRTWGLKRKVALALKISPQAIGQWHRIPAERVIEVEKITSIPRAQLRPDLYP